jgi:pilus assembly protein CpaD
MIRTLMILGLAASAAACTSTGGKSAQLDPILPTEQFHVAVSHSQDEILLALHPGGLSSAQASAVTDLVGRWRESGGGAVTIQAPSKGGEMAYHSASAVQRALLGEGVDQSQIRMTGYESDPASSAPAPIVVGFTRYEAHGPICGRDWKAYTKTMSNQPTSNFGCANTANFAAMLADPADLAAPRTMTPPDATRREVILGKYRTGDVTSSAKDSQATGAISSVVQ